MTRLDLCNCTIVASPGRAPFVDQAVADLAECTAGVVSESVEPAPRRTTVLVGKEAVREAAAAYPELSAIELDGLSDQGFLLKTLRAGDAGFVACSGGGCRGDAYAVIELVKAIDATGGRVMLDETDRREEPFFIRRGMYAHQHWAYAYPYALRTWEFEDWRRYIDLLAYLKINFFSIWSMAGILPSPLSEGDHQYLENYRCVIDYARDRRGMEVFIGECANNVAESDGGVPVRKRRYFDVEVLKDPGDPNEFREIMDNRRSLYEVAGNADGYWIIDSDPGGFEGSPVSEFVDILVGNRGLIDECTDKGADARLAYWMWMGWGKGKTRDECEELPRRALEGMRDRLKEPWVLLACWPNHLDAARDMGYIDKSIFFPYGAIEDEPSPPTTRLRFDEIYFHLNNAISTWGARSAMGNAQSPLAQLPNIFFFAETVWHGVPPARPADADVVGRLARLLAPDVSADLAEGWLMLRETDAGKVAECADRLEGIVSAKRVGRTGALGGRYFPGIDRLIADLAMQLRVHAEARVLLKALARSAPAADTARALLGYYAASLAWRDMHDYRRYMLYSPDVNEIGAQWKTYRDRVAFPAGLLAGIKQELLAGGHDEVCVDGFLALTPVE